MIPILKFAVKILGKNVRNYLVIRILYAFNLEIN